MSDNGFKTKYPKLKLQNAVDMATHLEEVIQRYSKKSSSLTGLLPHIAPNKQEPEKDSFKGTENSTIEESASQPPTPSLSAKDNRSTEPSLASNSPLSLATTIEVIASPKEVVKEQTMLKKRKYQHKAKCKYCEFRAPKQRYVEAHMLQNHANKKQVCCSISDDKTSHKTSVDAHKLNAYLYNKKIHGNKLNKKRQCALCEKVIATADFTEHMTTHANASPVGVYRCIVSCCNYLGRLNVFKRHLASCHPDLDQLSKTAFKHTLYGEENYLCRLCEFVCFRKLSLRLHYRHKHPGSAVNLQECKVNQNGLIPNSAESLISSSNGVQHPSKIESH